MLAKSSAVSVGRPEELGKDAADLSAIKLPQLVAKRDDKEEQKLGVSNVNSSLAVIDKHCPDLAPTIKLLKDRKLGIAIDAENKGLSNPEVLCGKAGDKLVAKNIVVSLGLANLATNKQEEALLLGALIKSLTLSESINDNGKLPTTAAEQKVVMDKYVKNLTAVRDALIKEGGKDSLDLAKGLDLVLADVKKTRKD